MSDWTFGGSWPYEPRFFETPEGRMHYIDEGARDRPPIVLLHGNPTWSYLYRASIEALLAQGSRVIAVDHLGFGRSEVPERPGVYTIARHTERLACLLDHLRLGQLVLVVHDWAGPIALPWVVASLDSLAGLVLLNTFPPRLPGPIGSLGSLRALRGRLTGPFLVERLNVPVERFLFKAGTAKARWDETAKDAYRRPHPTPGSRLPMLVFPREIPFDHAHPVAAQSRETAARLARLPADTPVRIIWGMKDVLFGPEVLHQWQALLPQAEVLPLDEAGHFIQEDEPRQTATYLAEFAERT